MSVQLGPEYAVAMQDHEMFSFVFGGRCPNAINKTSRMANIAAQASCSSCSTSLEMSNIPILACFANWLRLAEIRD